MNLSQLNMFVEVVEGGSVSKAARKKNLTQPAVTRTMQRLEKEVGMDLFERGEGHQLTLTRAGREFLIFAEKTLSSFNNLQEHWRNLRQEVQGPLKLAASTTPGEYVAPRILAKFITRYPNVEPSLAIMDSAEVEARVASREFDAGFTGKAATRPNLTNLFLFEDEIVLAVPVFHRFARAGKKEVELAELENEAFIDREEGSGTSQSLQQRLAEHKLEFPPHRTVMALGSTQAIISSVAAGLGIGFVSKLAAGEASGRVFALNLSGLSLKRNLFLVYETGKETTGSLLMREFLQFVSQGRDGFFPLEEVE